MYISDTKVYYERLIHYDLSLIEYCVADYIYTIASNSKNGFCFMRKEKMAKILGIGVATLYRILKKLQSKSILVKSGELLSVENWDKKGNFYYIRHELMEEMSKDMKINLSMEEYAIADIVIKQPRIKICELQRRINCSKMGTYLYIKNIENYGFIELLGKAFLVRDILIRHYFYSYTQKELEDEQENNTKQTPQKV